MQCHSCRFESLPGLDTCARCGSPLRLGEAAIEPPRAARLNVGTRVRRSWFRARAATPDLGPVARLFTRLQTAPIPWASVAWSIVPGMGQVRLGARRVGWTLLGVWAALLLLSLVMLGTAMAQWLWYLAVSVHATTIVLLFGDNLVQQRIPTRLAFGVLVFAVVQFALYAPLQNAAANIATTLTLDGVLPGPVVANGDVVLVAGTWLRPPDFRRGDLVVYRTQPVYAAGYWIQAGYGVDRIVGVPGDTVDVASGVLRVNGVEPPATERPLGPLPRVLSATWRVDHGEFVIFPTRLRLVLPDGRAGQELLGAAAVAIFFVNESDVMGRPLWRLRPWSRFGRVE